MSFSGNLSQAKYHNGKNLKGYSTSLKYAKALGDNANLQLIGYRFNSENYIDYADFTYNSYSFIKTGLSNAMSQSLPTSYQKKVCF